MSNNILGANIFDDCSVLFFILVFLLLFWGRGFKRTATNEVE